MNLLERFKKIIENSNRILITTHIVPDADGIGSEISLCLALRKLGKKALCVNEEDLLLRYKYLDQRSVIVGAEDFQANYRNENQFKEFDLLIVVDTNTTHRVGSKMQKILGSKKVLFIDHHPCPEVIKSIHCIDTTAAATGQLVGKLIQAVGITFDKEMALPLYTSILIDTSSFRYPTVSADTHRIVSKLLDTGINPPMAYNGIYGTKKIPHMHLLGSILASTEGNSSGEIAWITVSQQELDKFGIDVEDTYAFINNLLILDNIKVALMFRDTGNQVKVSFRSTGDIDVGIMAQALGGGGHNHSAATLIEGNLEDVIHDTVAKIEVMLKSTGDFPHQA
ncbi:MAG: DHH family phosphoesterase [Bacteriovoracaceae bacterium]